jgi:hypothetical protein
VWQNRSPGLKAVLHPAQTAVSRDAPQLEQNRPVPRVEHAVQIASEADGCVMSWNLTRACQLCSQG